jgi:hypothetical protein
MKKRSLPLSMRCPEFRERFSLRSNRRQRQRIGNKRRLKQGHVLFEDSAVNSRVKIAAIEHACLKRMFMCDFDFLGIQLKREFSRLKRKPKKHELRFTILVTRAL